MTRTMYDGVTPSKIPASATMVAGYVDGHYANIPAMQKRFPHATLVKIAVSWKTKGAHVLDVERGDATPAEAVKWCTQTMVATPNSELTLYANASTMTQIRAAFKAAGVTLPQLWLASWDGKATVPAGYVAKQFENTSGYDRSAVVAAGGWHGVDPKAPPKPPTPAKPKVSLKNVVASAKADPKAKQGHTTHPADVKPVEAALKAEGLLAAKYASDGSFGSLTVAAYAAWQRKCGYSGKDADGIPGKTTLKKLGSKHGFTVTT